ncbi:hypothetical protein ACHAWX_001150 [Stephanocyclus meneghinianus]
MESIAAADPQQPSAADIEKSIESTLAEWRSCFDDVDASPVAHDHRTTSAPSRFHEDRRTCRSPEAYHSRLGSFRPETYFAKPSSLSPLVCAAFGWENTDVDILQCKHPKCNAVLCIAFHPGLNKQCYDELNEQYLQMLSSCHSSTCPFKDYSGRWLKVMRRQCNNNTVIGSRRNETHGEESIESEKTHECLLRKTTEALKQSPQIIYVPPYFLSLSDAFLRFEDHTNNGSITREWVEKGSSENSSVLRTRFPSNAEFEIKIPDAVMSHCRGLSPDVDTAPTPYCDVENAARLLSAFGWHIQRDTPKDSGGCIVQCHICLARSWLSCRPMDGREAPSKKRRRERMNDAILQLIDSHRVYCPYVGGFSFWVGHRTELPGWKVVVSNLAKSTCSKVRGGPLTIFGCLWGEEC